MVSSLKEKSKTTDVPASDTIQRKQNLDKTIASLEAASSSQQKDMMTLMML
jgi:hypothetical protein